MKQLRTPKWSENLSGISRFTFWGSGVGKKTKKIHKQGEIFKKGSAVGLTAGPCGKVFERQALNVKTGNSAGDATVIGFAIVCGYLIAFTQVAFANSNGE